MLSSLLGLHTLSFFFKLFFLAHNTLFFFFFVIILMDYYLFQPYRKPRVNHTANQSLRKCCGCIHLRFGSAVACVIWAVSNSASYTDVAHFHFSFAKPVTLKKRVYRCTLQAYLSKALVVSKRKREREVKKANKSLTFRYTAFYSFLSQAPLLVFGVTNLILSVVAVGGLVALYLV